MFGEHWRVFGFDPATYPWTADLLAAGAIAFAAMVNILGVQLGALFVGLSTMTKFGALAALVLLSFILGDASGASWSNVASTGAVTSPACMAWR